MASGTGDTCLPHAPPRIQSAPSEKKHAVCSRVSCGARSGSGDKGVARWVETPALACVGQNIQKTTWESGTYGTEERAGEGTLVAYASESGPGSDMSVAVRGVTLFRAQQSTIHGKGLLGSDQIFSQVVRGLGIAHLALHDRGRGKKGKTERTE